jgi:LysM repeat protein
VRKGLSGHRRITLIIVLLILALSACERPLLDREAEPAVEPVGTPQQTLPLAVPTPEITLPDETITPAAEVTPEGEEPGTPVDEVPAEVVPDPETGSSQIEYIVQAGDTLGLIAQRYNVSIEALAAANGISNVNVLDLGQKLVIPVGGEIVQPAEPAAGDGDPTVERVHIVQPGENLFRIGIRYGFTYQELATYNGLADPTRLSVGQEIRIPPGGN